MPASSVHYIIKNEFLYSNLVGLVFFITKSLLWYFVVSMFKFFFNGISVSTNKISFWFARGRVDNESTEGQLKATALTRTRDSSYSPLNLVHAAKGSSFIICAKRASLKNHQIPIHYITKACKNYSKVVFVKYITGWVPLARTQAV